MAKDRTGSRGVVGVVDAGTDKVCCLIWRPDGTGVPGSSAAAGTLIGLGHHRSEGIEGGLVTDLAAAERVIRAAIGKAERMAGVLLDEVVVGVGGGRIVSHRFAAGTPLDHGVVRRASLDKLVRASTRYASRDGRSVIHLDLIGLSLDDGPVAGNPLGLAGDHLKSEVHAVSTDTATLAPLDAVIERCYLTALFVPSALASGLAVTRADEREIGVTVVDIGAGSTTLAHFSGGRFVSTGVIAAGGRHITQEVAHRLQTSLAEAERIKTLYGSLIAAPSNELERVSYPTELDGDLQMVSVTRAEIRRVMEPRLEELMRQVAEWRVYNGPSTAESGCVVLTGGGSLLVGIGSFAADRLGVPVRVGEPTAETGAPGNVRIAGYATALGLVAAARVGRRESEASGPSAVLGSEYLGRVGDWLKRNF